MPGAGGDTLLMLPHLPDLLNVFTAAQISTSIRAAERVALRSSPNDAYQRLSSLRFDQAPVVDRNHVVGWVSTANLVSAERVKGVMKPLDLSAIVSNETSIAGVLQLLGRDGFVFTVGESGINGFITPSDLERHAARSHFYLLITGIEMIITAIVRGAVDARLIVDRLAGESRERWDADVADDNETDPSEYLYLRDLAELLLELPQVTADAGWETGLTNTLTELCHIRPSVMHSNRPLLRGRSAAQLASLARGAEVLTGRLEQIAARV